MVIELLFLKLWHSWKKNVFIHSVFSKKAKPEFDKYHYIRIFNNSEIHSDASHGCANASASGKYYSKVM